MKPNTDNVFEKRTETGLLDIIIVQNNRKMF